MDLQLRPMMMEMQKRDPETILEFVKRLTEAEKKTHELWKDSEVSSGTSVCTVSKRKYKCESWEDEFQKMPLSELTTDGKKMLQNSFMHWSPGSMYLNNTEICSRPECKKFPKRLYTVQCPPPGHAGELIQVIKCCHPLCTVQLTENDIIKTEVSPGPKKLKLQTMININDCLLESEQVESDNVVELVETSTAELSEKEYQEIINSDLDKRIKAYEKRLRNYNTLGEKETNALKFIFIGGYRNKANEVFKHEHD